MDWLQLWAQIQVIGTLIGLWITGIALAIYVGWLIFEFVRNFLKKRKKWTLFVNGEKMPIKIDDPLTNKDFGNRIDFITLESSINISTPEKLAAYRKWKLEDGSREGLLELKKKNGG